MKDSDKSELERLADLYGLEAVICNLSDICFAKSKQTGTESRLWARAGNAILKLGQQTIIAIL